MSAVPPGAAGPSTRRGSLRTSLYDPRNEHDACGVGFVVDIKGRKSHAIIEKGLQVLLNLLHRGACGCEANTGDGAGILIQTPDAFLRAVVPFSLPAPGAYAAGLVFLPHDDRDKDTIKSLVARIVEAYERAAITSTLDGRAVKGAVGAAGEVPLQGVGGAFAVEVAVQQLFPGSAAHAPLKLARPAPGGRCRHERRRRPPCRGSSAARGSPGGPGAARS